MDDRLAETRRLGELGAARNHGFKNFRAEQVADFADDFVGQFRATIEHRHHDAENLQTRIDARVAQLAEHAVHHRDAFERVILALQRHEQTIARGKGVQGQDAERRRAINQDNIKSSAVQNRFERLRDALQMIFEARDFQVGGAQIHFARNDFEPLVSRRLYFFEEISFAEQNAIRARAFNFFQADAAGCVGLRVEVKKQNALAERGEAGGKIDGGGGFSHATFLVGDRDDFGWHSRN